MDEKKKENEKKITKKMTKKMILVVSILIVAVIVVVFFFLQNTPQNKSSLSLTPVRVGQEGSKEKTAQRKKSLIVLADAMNGELNPARATTNGEMLANSFLFEPLARRDANGVMKNVLAKSIKYSQDGKSMTVQIYKKLFFSDKTPVTANDVVASISLGCYMGEISCQEITGSAAFVNGETNKLKGVTAVNDTTIKIDFDTAQVTNQMVLEIPIQKGDFVNWDSGGNPFLYLAESLGNGIGTGAYVLESSQPDTILLKSNPEYRFRAPDIKQVEIQKYVFTELSKTLEKGDVDVVGFTKDNPAFDKLFKDEGLSIYECPQEQLLCLAFNYDIKMMQNQKLRQGISYALDRETLITKEPAQYYSPESSFLLEGNIYGTKGVLSKNTSEGRKLVKEAKKELGLDEIVLRLPLLKGDNIYKSMAKKLKKQLSDVGIELKINYLDQAEYMDTFYLRNGFDICFTGESVTAHYSSLSKLLESRNGLPVAPTNTSNFTQELAALKEKGGVPEENITTIGNFQAKMYEEAILIPVARRKQFLAVSADLTGYQVTPYGTLIHHFGKAKAK